MHDRLCPDCEPFELKTEGTSRRRVVQSIGAAAAVAAMLESPAVGQKKMLNVLSERDDEAGCPKAYLGPARNGSAFVWHWRGSRHVPAVAGFTFNPGVKLNARG